MSIELLNSIGIDVIYNYLNKYTAKDTAIFFGVKIGIFNKWCKINGVTKKDLIKEKRCKLQLSDIQKDVLLGSLLGDGSLSKIRYKKGINSSYTETHGFVQYDWLNWKYNILRDFFDSCIKSCFNFYIKKIDGKNIINKDRPKRNYFRYRSIQHKIFTELEQEWYLRNANNNYIFDKNNKRIKIVPKTLKLTPLMLAVWYLDDGVNCFFSKRKARYIILCTDSFSQEECLFLVEELKRLGISDCGIKLYNNKYYRIFVYASSFEYFINMVTNALIDLNIPDCMKYKLTNAVKNKSNNFGENHSNAKYSEKDIINVIDLYNSGLNYKEISRITKVNVSSIREVIKGRSWKHLFCLVVHRSYVSNTNKSGVVGVYYDNINEKWIANITINKKYFKKSFLTKEEAILERDKMEKMQI